jgi:predicted membrane-bound dolichyl-phosphate-mannose-protein mannosyltransferase
MELQINYVDNGFDPLEKIKERKIHVIASCPQGLSPAGCYMSELNIQLTEDEGKVFYETLLKKKETICLYPNNLTIVPPELSVTNIIECFDANEKYVKIETMYFDIEQMNNDIYAIVSKAINNYQFRVTKNIYIDARDVKEKWKSLNNNNIK